MCLKIIDLPTYLSNSIYLSIYLSVYLPMTDNSYLHNIFLAGQLMMYTFISATGETARPPESSPSKRRCFEEGQLGRSKWDTMGPLLVDVSPTLHSSSHMLISRNFQRILIPI